jgi:hypothetical protein
MIITQWPESASELYRPSDRHREAVDAMIIRKVNRCARKELIVMPLPSLQVPFDKTWERCVATGVEASG